LLPNTLMLSFAVTPIPFASILFIWTSRAQLRWCKTKDAFCEAATNSLDGAMNIYPVQMFPIDWFLSLSTSFAIEDLTSDREIIFQQSLDSSIHSKFAWPPCNSSPRTTSKPYSLRLNKPSPRTTRLSPISERHTPATSSHSRKAS